MSAKTLTEDDLKAITVGEVKRLAGKIQLVEYDANWPALFRREEARIRAALGQRALLIEHIGSTSVPGLAAKPIIDIVVAVVNSADEDAYAPALLAKGYILRIREANWFEHRMFKGPDTDVNLHVYSESCTEIALVLGFRDWLRSNDADRELYERTKRELAAKDWTYTQNYADAKSDVVAEIMARAQVKR